MLWRGLKWLLGLAIGGLLASLIVVFGATYHFSSQGLDAAKSADADVILVLSAGLTRDKDVLDAFSRERVATAVDLWRSGAAPMILMSGGVDRDIGQHVGERMKQAAIEIGAPEPLIFVEGVSVSTFENARFTLDVARAEGWRRAIVVTDDFHLLRARALFEFWRREDDMTIIALAPASGRMNAPLQQAAWVFLREALAIPYNIGKVALQIGLEQIGRGDERMIQ